MIRFDPWRRHGLARENGASAQMPNQDRDDRAPPKRVAIIDDLVIDFRARIVRRVGRRLDLPTLSFEVLAALVEAWPAPLDAEALVARAWNGVSVSGEAVRQRIRQLRVQLGDAEGQIYIRTLRGQGYCLASPVSWRRAAPRALFLRWRVNHARIAAIAAAAVFATALTGAAAGGVWDFTPYRELKLSKRAYMTLPVIRIGDFAAHSDSPESAQMSVQFQRLLRDRLGGASAEFRAIGAAQDRSAVGLLPDGYAHSDIFQLNGAISDGGAGPILSLEIVDEITGLRMWRAKFALNAGPGRDLRRRLVDDVLAALQTRLGGDARPRLAWMRAGVRPTYYAFLRGLEMADAGDWAQAVQILDNVAAQDDCFAMAHAALAHALVRYVESSSPPGGAAAALLQSAVAHADAAIVEYVDLPQALAARAAALSLLASGA